MCDGEAGFTVSSMVSIAHTGSHTVLTPLHVRVARERLEESIAGADRERLARGARRRAHRDEVDRVRASVLLLPRTNAETRREA
jgi:hypothetical protein